MKCLPLYLLGFIGLCSFNYGSQPDAACDENSIEINSDYDSTDSIYHKTLNDIRFENWTDKDWLDNDYIHALRGFIDEYLCGNIRYPELDPYKEYLNSKFVIGDINSALLGGAFIRIIFLDMPDRIFSCWVYSDVDEEKEIVTDYSVRLIKLEEERIEQTKADILQTIQEHPELKLW